MFIAALAACAVLASCSKDNEGPNGNIENAVLKITVTSPSNTRASGTAPGTDTNVSNFTVFVTDQAGAVKWKQFVSGTDEVEMTVNNTAAEVYVIANAGNQTANFTTKTGLLAGKEKLDSQFTGRWATGNSALSFTYNATDKVYEDSVNLELQFIAARITLSVNNIMTGYTGDDSDGTVFLDKVYVLNARGESLLFPGTGTSLIPSSYTAGWKFLSGLASSAATSFANWPLAADLTDGYANLITDYSWVSGTPVSSYYFYVYESDSVTPDTFPTIITLAGIDTNGDPVYFPAHLAPYEEWTSTTTDSVASVKRGHSYNITMNLKGDATSGGGGGTPDPTDPVTKATVEITISIDDWVPVTLGKDFQ